MKIRIGLAVSALVIALVIFVKTPVKIEDVGKALDLAALRGPLALVWPETQVSWPLSMPDRQGIDGEKLRQLSSALVSQNTSALLLLRNGFLLHEWYEPGRAVGDRHFLAAATKGAVAGLLVLLAVEEGWAQLADRASTDIPEWEVDPWKSRVTIHQLASHRSGLEDLWGGDYTRDRRFRIALDDAKFFFEPGSHQSYSGTAFYVLARVLATRLHANSEPGITKLYDGRLMEPLGIPLNAYRISYGESYEEDGLDLYAIGSGGSFTPRASARIGQMVLGKGNWPGEQLLQPETMEMLLGDTATTRVTSWQDEPFPIANLGWWLNVDGFFPSLPCDAVVAKGSGEQILLVVPSLELVLVRNGQSIAQEGESAWSAMETRLFRPLMEALVLQEDDSASNQSVEDDSTSLGCSQSGPADLAVSIQG